MVLTILYLILHLDAQRRLLSIDLIVSHPNWYDYVSIISTMSFLNALFSGSARKKNNVPATLATPVTPERRVAASNEQAIQWPKFGSSIGNQGRYAHVSIGIQTTTVSHCSIYCLWAS
jgi:hypothetical protein